MRDRVFTFKPGRSLNPVIFPHRVILAAVTAAVARTAVSLYLYYNPSLLDAAWERNTLRLLVTGAPVFLAVYNRRNFDAWWAAMQVTICFVLATATYAAMYGTRGFVDGLGVSNPLDDIVIYLVVAGPILALAIYAGIRGFFAAVVEWSWLTRCWTIPRRLWWSVPLLDPGAALGLALVIAFPASFLPDSINGPACVLALALLAIPLVCRLLTAVRRYPMLERPSGMALTAAQRWMCEQVGADYVPPNSEEVAYASRSVWWEHELIMARVETPDGPRWVAISGRNSWDKKVWYVPVVVFETMRPDLAPFLGLPVGWVLTTAPPAMIRWAPEIVAAVVDAVQKCKVVTLSGELARSPRPLVEVAASASDS